MEDGVILVTGASGYIGSHCVKQLLEDGYKVRGTVRSLQDEAKVDPLKSLVPDPKYPLELAEANLMDAECWNKVVEGCSGILHVASPFPNLAEKSIPEEEIIGPAKEGTLNVLKAAAFHASTVKRVIITSSAAAVCAQPEPDGNKKLYTEEDWADPESPTIDAYCKSKVIAEKAAWDYVKELPEEQKFEMVVINPSFVVGPVLCENHKHATSVAVIMHLLTRKYPAMPQIGFCVCDVRDVATAHIKALTIPEAVNNRHLINTEKLWMRDIAGILAKEFKPQGYSVSTAQLPYFLCYLAGFVNRGIKTFVLPRIGKMYNYDNKRMKEVLGVEPTDAEKSIQDMAYSLIDFGIVRKSKKYKQAGSRVENQQVSAIEAEQKKETLPTNDDVPIGKELEPEDKAEKERKIDKEESKAPEEIQQQVAL